MSPDARDVIKTPDNLTPRVTAYCNTIVPGIIKLSNGDDVSIDLFNKVSIKGVVVHQLLSPQVHALEQLVKNTSCFPVKFEPF